MLTGDLLDYNACSEKSDGSQTLFWIHKDTVFAKRLWANALDNKHFIKGLFRKQILTEMNFEESRVNYTICVNCTHIALIFFFFCQKIWPYFSFHWTPYSSPKRYFKKISAFHKLLLQLLGENCWNALIIIVFFRICFAPMK